MAIETTEQVASSGLTVDAVGIVTLLTAPLYWDLLERFGHLVMMALGIAFIAYRVIGQRLTNKRLADINRRRGIE